MKRPARRFKLPDVFVDGCASLAPETIGKHECITLNSSIRAWLEPHPSAPLRAIIRRATDLGDGFGPRLALSDADAVLEVVHAWLQDVEEVGRSPGASEALGPPRD